MPTGLLHTANSFLQEDQVVASEMGMRSPRALTIDADKIQPDANARKIIRPGTILYKMAGATEHRVGLRTNLETAITTSSTVINLAQQGKIYQSETAQYFDDADVLKVLRPYGTITLADTWDTDDTLAVSLAGQPVTYTPGSATLATAATNTAADINADPYHSRLVLAIADGAIIYLFSKSRAAHTLSVTATTTGNGTATASGTELAGNVTVGTIDTNGVNAIAGTVTLASTATIALPAGAPIGVEGEPHGLIIGCYDASKAETDIAGFTAGSVYGDRLPYWDDDIASLMPEITFV